MSYILDAIQKAERERREQQTPDVYSVQAGGALADTARRGVDARWLVGGVLVIVLSNLAVWYMLKPTSANDAPHSVAHEPLATPSTESPAHSSSPAISEAELPTAGAKVQLWQAPADAQTAIGALDFSFHVYAERAAQRMIIINGQQMREGEQISPDLTLITITEGGVLLDYRGTLVEVEILEQW